MNFKLDFTEASKGEYKQIEDGTYEVVIEQAKEDANQNTGTEFLDFRLRIRNDVKQAFQNQIIFYKVWRSKQTNTYHSGMINTLAKAASLENGKSYKNLEELLADFLGKPLKVNVKNEESEYNGKTYQNLNVKYTDQSEYPNVQHVKENKDPNPQFSSPIEIPDSDFPF